jgi:integrase
MRPLSGMAMSMLVCGLAAEVTVHGFRSSFRVWYSEVAKIDFALAELCLSHRMGNKVSRDYNRTTMLERRAPIMVDWANYVCAPTLTTSSLFALMNDA